MPENIVTDALRQTMADTYALYGKTHGYHWNVTDARFPQLHALFSDQYTEMWNALDELAEQIRVNGAYAPQGFTTLGNLSGIGSGDPTLTADAMIEDLLAGHEVVIATLRQTLKSADAADDPVAVDVLTGRLAAHEKHRWVLRATLGRPDAGARSGAPYFRQNVPADLNQDGERR